MAVTDGDVLRAAGGVVARWGALGPEILLVHRPAYDDWSLPKGKLNQGETLVAAALREVEEETGLRCKALSSLGKVDYRDRQGRPKTVRYWLMEPVEPGRFGAPGEVDQVAWRPLDQACQQMTYDGDRKLAERVPAGPPQPGSPTP